MILRNILNSDLRRLTLFDEVVLDSEGYTKHLILRGDNINALNYDNRTPLMAAANGGKIEAVALLIRAGANLDHQDDKGSTALHLAFTQIAYASPYLDYEPINYTSGPCFSIISMLYAARAEPLLDKNRRTPLMCLDRCFWGDSRAIDFCIKQFYQYEAAYYSCDKMIYNGTIREYYVDSQSVQVSLARTFASTNQQRVISSNLKEQFHIALETNNIAKVRLLLDNTQELDVNNFMDERGYRPLNIVIRANVRCSHSKKDCRPLLKLLLERGADVNGGKANYLLSSQSPLLECVTNLEIKVELIVFLLENGVNASFSNSAYNQLIRFATRNDWCEENLLAQEWLLHYCDDINGNIFIKSDLFNYPKSVHILNKFIASPGSAVDVALSNMTSVEDINLILYSFRHKVYFYAHHSNQHISFVNLIDSLIENESLSSFSKNRLTYLLKLQKQSAVNAPSHVNPIDFYHFSRFMESLYEAMVDINKVISSAASGFKDTGALQSLSLWKRKQNPNPVIAAQAQQDFDKKYGLIVHRAMGP